MHYFSNTLFTLIIHTNKPNILISHSKMHSLTGILVHTFITFFVMATAAENNIITDQRSLLALKLHITDDPTNSLSSNWSSTTSVCHWIGVTCSTTRPYRVTSLNISNFGLRGTIPPQIGDLSSLQLLDLSHNHLSGTIPSSIFDISSL